MCRFFQSPAANPLPPYLLETQLASFRRRCPSSPALSSHPPYMSHSSQSPHPTLGISHSNPMFTIFTVHRPTFALCLPIARSRVKIVNIVPAKEVRRNKGENPKGFSPLFSFPMFTIPCEHCTNTSQKYKTAAPVPPARRLSHAQLRCRSPYQFLSAATAFSASCLNRRYRRRTLFSLSSRIAIAVLMG